MEDDYTRITLRIPRDLHEQLASSAELTSKSMNAEIIARLRDTFSQGRATPQYINFSSPAVYDPQPFEPSMVDVLSEIRALRGLIESSATYHPQKKENDD